MWVAGHDRFEPSNNKRSRIGVRHATHKNFTASQQSERIETERSMPFIYRVNPRIFLRRSNNVFHEWVKEKTKGKKGYNFTTYLPTGFIRIIRLSVGRS